MTSSPSPARGAWVDLLAVEGHERVVVRASVGDAALLRLGARVADLAVLEGPTDSHDRLVALLDGSGAQVTVGPMTTVAPEGSTFDLVVTTPEGARALERLARLVSPAGRLVVLADNPLSPLRALDRLTGHPGGPTLGRLRPLRQSLAAGGLGSVVVFGLLRSSAEPTTAFRLDLPQIADTVLRATAAGSGRSRRWAIDALRVAARRGVAGQLLSAWLVVAGRQPVGVGDDEPTGRIAVAANEQGVVLLGPGPAGIEKHYQDLAQLEATASALDELAAAGIDVGTRVIGRPAHDRLRLSWAPGCDLDAARLQPAELSRWLERAAAALGAIQRATLDEAGQVLVHGDFWLGCLVVDGDRISGIIDWTDAHRGDPRTDLHSLVQVLAERPDLGPVHRQEILGVLQQAHEAAGGPPAAHEGLEGVLAG